MTDTPTPNHGLIHSGPGTLNAQALAIGERATAVNQVIHNGLADRADGELATRLSQLVEQVQQHAAQIPDSAGLLAATENVAAELAKEQPSTFTVTALLGAIAAGAGSVTSVVEAVQAVQAVL